MDDGIIVLITASSGDEAARIGKALVDEHLAACVNVIPSVRSFFFWEGTTQDAHELLMLCKSRKHVLEKLIHRVKALHSYSVPEIIALPVAGGSEDYLAWFRENTGG
jgi:periplasmic divalent cation tolerance protein